MKWQPEGSITPSGPGAPVVLFSTSRSKVRSMEPLAGRREFAYRGLATAAYNGSLWLVMPCSGRSIATTTKPPCANASATANMSSRLRVMPCWKISTGQPPAGAAAWPEEALGTVTSTGIGKVWVGTGSGLKRVTNVLVLSSGNGGAFQDP